MLEASKPRNQTSGLLFMYLSAYRLALSHRLMLTETSNRILSQYSLIEWQEKRTVGCRIVEEEEPELNGYNSRQGLD